MAEQPMYWMTRPLTRVMIQYARHDVELLPYVYRCDCFFAFIVKADTFLEKSCDLFRD